MAVTLTTVPVSCPDCGATVRVPAKILGDIDRTNRRLVNYRVDVSDEIPEHACLKFALPLPREIDGPAR